MLRVLTFSFVLLMLSGCASVEIAPTSQLTNSERVTQTSYEIGVPIESFVGSTMIRVQDYQSETFTGTQVKIMKPFSITGFNFNRSFSVGATYPYGGTTKLKGTEMNFFFVDSGYGVLYDETGTVQEKILVVANGTSVFPIYTYENDGGTGAVARENVERVTNTPGGQNFEIIYSGIDGDTIRLNYREYSDGDMARSAFFQELTYPKSSEVIRFRNLALKVLSADGDRIKFSVQQD
jgi:hypothetical protein